MSETRLTRGRLLLSQSKHELAEREFRAALSADPEDALAHSLLALALSGQKKEAEALSEARSGVELGPNVSYTHYVLGALLLDRDRDAEAERCAREAVRLDPEDADYRGFLARVHFSRKEWAKAVGAAEEGLALEPDNVDCLNIRGLALVQLGRRGEAGEAIDAALAREPDNPQSHNVKGWALLHAGKHEEALAHFQEALRVDPTMESARDGVVEALKARNIVYRLMLRYFLWMSRLSGSSRWAFIIGAYLAYRVLLSAAKTTPAVRPFVWPLLGLYLAFVFLSWTAKPLFNLLLRLNRYGRLALSREEVVASNAVGGLLLGGLAALAGGLLLKITPLFFLGLLSCLMVLPAAVVLGGRPGRSRRILSVYALALAAVGLTAIALDAAGLAAAGTLFIVFLLGFFGFQLAANVLE